MYFLFIIYYYVSPSAWNKALPALYLSMIHAYQGAPLSHVIMFIFAALGDFFLFNDTFFIPGMIAFALFHLILIDIISSVGPVSNLRLWIRLPLYSMSLLLLGLYSRLSWLVFPMVIYTVILTRLFEVCVAWCQFIYNKDLAVGGFLFIISDGLILLQMLFSELPTLSLPIYWISLYLISYDLMNQPVFQRFGESVRVD